MIAGVPVARNVVAVVRWTVSPWPRSDATTAADVDGWDSMAHINLIVAIEKKFGVKFTAADIASMRGEGQNVGRLVELIATKAGQSGGA